MAYTKYSLTPASNNAAPPDGAPEGMLPSAVNDTMRDMMAQIRDCGDGLRDGTYTMTAVKITGGTITGITDLAVADGGTGASSFTSGALLKGAGTSAITTATAGTDYPGLATAQSFTAAQRGSISALTDGSTVTPDFAVANNFSLAIGGNRTLANPSNLTAGQSGAIVITQDGTGSRTLAYGSYFKFSGGTAPTLTTTASAVDVLVYFVESSTRITAKLLSDVK
jgi:hypothetical protein